MRHGYLTTLVFCIVAGCGGGSSDELSESDNLCGGTSKVQGLVGGSNWSDAIDPRCTTPPFYGEKCKSTSDGEFHRCED
ncbi:MAG TPA: hypothetical protein VJV78_48670 [Polyangiales bacterium]|nr:hypothetical protein [Polyangiales bacterium]